MKFFTAAAALLLTSPVFAADKAIERLGDSATAARVALEPHSDPFAASPGCTGVHSRTRPYTGNCAENGVPERT